MHRLVALVLVAAGSPAALAHKMEVVATIPPESLGTVRVVVSYDTDDLAEKAAVTVLDAGGQTVAEGVTDDKGVCNLPRPKAGTYTVRGDDGAGHRAEVTLTVPPNESEAAEARSEKRNRVVMAVVGLSTIGALTLIVTVILRKRTRKAVPE